MPWLNSVQDLILQKIYQHADANTQLIEALRWRGFPAISAEGRIQLVHASTSADAVDLRALSGFDALVVIVTPIAVPEEPDRLEVAARTQLLASLAGDQPTPIAIVPCATVGWQSSVDEATRHQTLAEIIRLGSPQEGLGPVGNQLYKDYFLPTTELDQGVALLARSMALLGLTTELSGHGTDQCSLYVRFNDLGPAIRFHRFFDNELRPLLDDDDGDIFTCHAPTYEIFCVGQPSNDPAEALRLFAAAKRLGSLILDNLSEFRSRW